ncbi:MAG: hypothetical protein WCS03_06855 [Bacteroidota bacterium]
MKKENKSEAHRPKPAEPIPIISWLFTDDGGIANLNIGEEYEDYCVHEKLCRQTLQPGRKSAEMGGNAAWLKWLMQTFSKE